MEEETLFSAILREFRKEIGVTQLELSMRFQKHGYPVDSSTVSKYETGERSPNADYIPHFSKVLGLSRRDSDAIFRAYKAHFSINAEQEYLEGIADAKLKD